MDAVVGEPRYGFCGFETGVPCVTERDRKTTDPEGARESMPGDGPDADLAIRPARVFCSSDPGARPVRTTAEAPLDESRPLDPGATGKKDGAPNKFGDCNADCLLESGASPIFIVVGIRWSAIL